VTRAERTRRDRRARRLARYQAVLALHQQGRSIRAIAQRVDLQRATVRRFLQAGRFPERVARAPSPSVLDPVRPYLQRRWQAGCQNARQLFHELVQQGFTGSESLVQRAVRAWRPARSTQRPRSPAADRRAATAAAPKRPAVSPRQASGWLLALAAPQEPVERHRRQAIVTHLCDHVPAVAAARTLGTAFLDLIRQRRAGDLPHWLTRAEQAGLPEFKGFARSLQSDYDAVGEACRLPWSQGQVEGQVTRLKLIKRSMYGRAGFDLLRIRVLTAA
jgi:transposase